MFQIIFLCSLLCALLTIYILVGKKDALKSYADYLLSFYVLFMSWNVVMYLLLYYAWIIEVPYLFKTAAPLAFLVPPFGYFYTRAVLYNERKFTINDVWHFIPFIIVTINYVPFFFMPNNEKKQIVQAVINNLDLSYQYNVGPISEANLFIMRMVQICLYTFFQWKLIIKYKKQNEVPVIENQIKLVIDWLKIFAWTCSAYIFAFIVLFTLVIFKISVFNNGGFVNLIPLIFIVSSFFLISTYLLTHPEVLNGLPFVKYKAFDSKLMEDEFNQVPFIEEDYSVQIAQIQAYFDDSKPYLNKNLSLNQVAVALNMSPRELSYILNNYLECRFTEYVNQYRIQYIIDNYNTSKFENYTIESIAFEAGFLSKSGFYKSFKKQHQMTPLEYFDKLVS